MEQRQELEARQTQRWGLQSEVIGNDGNKKKRSIKERLST